MVVSALQGPCPERRTMMDRRAFILGAGAAIACEFHVKPADAGDLLPAVSELGITFRHRGFRIELFNGSISAPLQAIREMDRCGHDLWSVSQLDKPLYRVERLATEPGLY